MLKRILILAGLLLLLSTSAFAGVDTIILGSEEVDADSDLGEMPLKNESELFGKHNSSNGGGDGDGTDSNGDGDGVDPSDSDLPDDSNAPVPEPATGVLLGVGVLGLARMLRRKSTTDDTE